MSPITITPVYPGAAVGVGVQISLASNFIGPLPAPVSWQVQLVSPTSEVDYFRWTAANQATLPSAVLQLGITGGELGFFDGDAPVEGQPVTVRAQLLDASGQVDAGETSLPFTRSGELAYQQQQLSGQGTGGFTSQDRAALTQVQTSTAVTSLLNLSTLELLPSSAPSAPVNAVLDLAIFGVIVRLTHVPPQLEPQTPDGDYWVKTLAVVRIFRGQDMWLRIPIHSSSKMIMLTGGDQLQVGIPLVVIEEWVHSITLQVDFDDGVEGEVYLMHTP